MATPKLHGHRKHLIEALAAEILHQQPESLLDAGCGEGYLLTLLSEGGVRASGVERNPRRVATALEAGRDVREGDVHELPFEDDAFDTVLIRHVLHHMDDPSHAVAEAARVARKQVILAEPATNSSIPSQGGMERLDRFLSELAARGGHVHHPFLDAHALIETMPNEPGSIELRFYGRLTVAPEQEVREMIDEDAHGQDLSAADLLEREALLEEARAGRISYNGSVTVFATLAV